MGTKIRIDSVMRPRSSSRGAIQVPQLLLLLRQLHWLPVRQRVTSKIAVLVFQCLTGQAPAYLADDCRLMK